MRASLQFAAIVLIGLACGAAARADPGELDKRLRADDIHAPLRTKIRASVERAVAFLIARQAADGSFAEHGKQRAPIPATTVTIRSALALRHAGTPQALAACDRAAAWLFDGGDERRADIESRVEDLGLALMLLLGLPERRPLVSPLADRLALALDGATGWWRRTARPESAGRPDLDASQTAVMGLLAARALKIPVLEDLWLRHARGLLSTQEATSNAWPLTPNGTPETLGTLHAVGSLAAMPSAETMKAIERTRAALGRDVGRTLSEPLRVFSILEEKDAVSMPQGKPPFEVIGREAGRREPVYAGDGAFARLYAVVRMSLLSGLRTVEAFPGGKSITERPPTKPTLLPCYATAAQWLVAHQRDDGGFAPDADDPSAAPSETDTALALLTLTRAASAYHATKPAPLDAVARPVPAAPAGSKGG